MQVIPRSVGSFYIQFLKYLDQICRETDYRNSHNEDLLYSQTLPSLQDSVKHMSRDLCFWISLCHFCTQNTLYKLLTLLYVAMMNCLLLQHLSVRCKCNKLQETLHPLTCITWQSFTQYDLCCHKSSPNLELQNLSIKSQHKNKTSGKRCFGILQYYSQSIKEVFKN